MRLLPSYFDFIKYGTKRIEFRLNDSKRRDIKKGDIIVFHKVDCDAIVKTKVVNLYYGDSFKQLFDMFDEEVIADISLSKEEVLNELDKIYPDYDQRSLGVVAIEIEIF